jgi:hypothetical protein
MRRSVLTISLAKHLKGQDVSQIIEEEWSSKASPEQQQAFDNQGFNLDPTDVDGTLVALNAKLHERDWDGVIVGWCTRGNKQFTPLFEDIVNMLADIANRSNHMEVNNPQARLKLMFCDGPDDLVHTTLRSFGDA